jgi:protein-S-isoprenylcysteine O-methyltransferase Ste14
MTGRRRVNFLQAIGSYAELISSMAGFVPGHASIPRLISFLASLVFSVWLTIQHPHNSVFALLYFFIAESLYIGFLSIVLSRPGLRLWFRKKWGEEKGYLIYEAILGILFFHNAFSIGYVASSTKGYFNFHSAGNVILTISATFFFTGFIVKLMAAKAVSTEVYYWKDMFLGRRICSFVESGPYKYLSNPMYGVGQIQAYSAALWYGSLYGLFAAFINQFLIFTFYFLFEKKFISRIYTRVKYREIFSSKMNIKVAH